MQIKPNLTMYPEIIDNALANCNSQKVFTPLRAVRKHCIDCCSTAHEIRLCTCDGVRSTRCDLWPYRFGKRPGTIKDQRLVTPGGSADKEEPDGED